MPRRQHDRHPTVRVRAEQGVPRPIDQSFTETFRIGRGAECQVRLAADVVSRTHLEVTFEDGNWWVRDLNSRNGTFADGHRVERLCLERQVTLRLAPDGPVLSLTIEQPQPERRVEMTAKSPTSTGSMDDYIRHYVKAADTKQPAGEHTMMIRRAVATVQAKQRRRYTWAATMALALIAVLVGYAVFQRVLLDRGEAARRGLSLKLQRQQQAAADLFDEMKSLDLQITQLKSVIEEKGGADLSQQVRRLEESRQRLARRYDGYIEELGTYRALNPEEKVIYRMARVFNESEFKMPAAFVKSVRKTIHDYWQTRGGRQRFIEAIQQAEKKGYTPHIVRTLNQHGLPAQFFYLALQESNLNVKAIGPPTRWGRAKGMWQFIPRTARLYGLDPGPYPDKNFISPQDERHDFEKATEAAARYLRAIYGTLAQASGLLVIASYNWGEHRIVDKLEKLSGPQVIPAEALEGIPENPTARNYWRFLGEYAKRMPEETKDYVLKIFSAAVIGEDPRLFGFDLDNPLEPYMEQMESSSRAMGGLSRPPGADESRRESLENGRKELVRLTGRNRLKAAVHALLGDVPRRDSGGRLGDDAVARDPDLDAPLIEDRAVNDLRLPHAYGQHARRGRFGKPATEPTQRIAVEIVAGI